jgi:short-subunit dehydrogenase
MDPAGKTVIITGASSGIGAAAARSFAQAGADVVLAARSREALEQLASELPGRPLVVATDMSNAADAQALIEQTHSARGSVDILINNAGVGVAARVADLEASAMQHVLAVNLLGPLALIQAALPVMHAQRRGQIINVSSLLAQHAMPRVGGYAASKAALERLSEALRMELRGSGIAVTVVRPGTTRTPFFTRRLGHEQQRWRPRGVPPERVAHTLLRAARTEPRLTYVTLQDRMALLGAALAPGLVETILARLPIWHEPPPSRGA